MAKRMKNPIEVRAIVLFDGNGLQIHEVFVMYGLSCEHGLSERKTLPLIQNPEIGNIIKDFVEEGIEQADVHEAIAEEDSLIEYPRP